MPESVQEDDTGALDLAERALRAEQVVVLPTDTVYGLAALAGSTPAVEQLYSLKGRPDSVPIALLVASLEQVAGLAGPIAPEAERLMHAFWPGPLTIVLADRGGDGTVAVRCPDRVFVRSLAARVGPMAVTSANRHGEQTPTTALDAAHSLDGEVALVIDGGPCLGTASTVVDGTDPSLPVLREGPVGREQIVIAALR